jgi:hypothetical protein
LTTSTMCASKTVPDCLTIYRWKKVSYFPLESEVFIEKVYIF